MSVACWELLFESSKINDINQLLILFMQSYVERGTTTANYIYHKVLRNSCQSLIIDQAIQKQWGVLQRISQFLYVEELIELESIYDFCS